MKEFARLVKIVAQLRGPGGCPWDAQQTPESLRPYLLEEAYEVLEAIEAGDEQRLCGELGDLLLMIVFLAQLATEREAFDIEEVCQRIADKLEYRHPHVFGQVQVDGADAVWRNWERLKRQEEEHQERDSILAGVPQTLPALQQAEALQKRAARVGFDWPTKAGPWEKIQEELQELAQAQETCEAERELGDLLFAICNYARFLRVDCESALRTANRRFRERFRRMEALAAEQGRELGQMTLAEMDALWERAKAEEADAAG